MKDWTKARPKHNRVNSKCFSYIWTFGTFVGIIWAPVGLDRPTLTVLLPLGHKISVPATFFNKSFQVLGIFHIPGSLFTFPASHTACLGNSFREFNPGTSFLASAASWNFSASLCEPPFLCLSRLQKLVLHEWCHVILSQPRGLYYFMAELR